MMRYLFVEHQESARQVEIEWAPAGEPAVPNFPSNPRNTFLGIPSFRPALFARVLEREDADLDAWAAALKRRFTGLPGALLDAYVVETAKFAYAVPVKTLVQPMYDAPGERLTFRVVEAPPNTMGVAVDDVFEIWRRQPVPTAGA